ncbi:solute carrier family 25 member 44 isoform X1 [Bos javanicus]|uniref:Solute carrier family 25 member 44 n=1 Tax=Bos taurus TaxID=9913 RepID=A0A3Q1MXP5_BOVIN|nr:solute carrier family 25 member 44 isoform X2 [Bos taurus]XP_061259653.1 solute carrier family 25 member 44 isoform X1 [Bos javanicus]
MRFADNERSMARGMARDKSEDPEAAVRGPGQKQLKACVIWSDAHATGLCRTLSSRDLEQHCSAELSAIIEVFCCLQNAFTHITSAPRSPGTMEDKRNIQIIEWEHLDKKKFYVFGVAMTMMIRVSVYPFTLIRTRLQVQKGRSLYHGTFDAFIKILRADGVTGLYRGFLVNTFTLISGQCYVTTYELTRKFVADYSQSNTVKSLVAGGSASLVAQSITVPIDVVSQHLMMQRKGEKMGRFQVRGNPEGQGVVAFGQTKDIIRQILRADGLRGFYRGYVASLLTYIPNSAVWWPFYHFYAEQLSSLCPKECPHIVFQAVSGPLAAATASILTNPMDVIRTRVQVEGKNSIILTFRQLMAEEGPWGLMKGLSARIISATPSTIVIVVGYESLKKLSLRPELVDSRHW